MSGKLLLRAHGSLLKRVGGPLELHDPNGAIHKFISHMTIANSIAAGSDQNSWGEITVWVGVPAMTRSLPSSGRLLVVEAEPERAQAVRHVLREQPKALVCEEVLAANNEEMVQWNRFNDARLNGPSSLSILRERFPNIQQIDGEQRSGRRLGDLLDNWSDGQVEQALAQLHLVLRQGDPLGALIGLGPWLSQLNTVQLILPWPEETMRLVETWLAEHGFRQDLQAATMWRLDLISKGDLLLKEKENQKQALLTANQQLNSACEAMRAEKELLVAKLEEISTLSQEAREAQNLALEDVQKSHIEAEKLKNNQESLRQELQQLHSEKSELLQKLQAEKATSYNIRESLKSLFPMQLYREENIDLRSHDEDNLVLHYVEFGRKEGRLKAYQELDAELKSSIKQNDEAEAKLERLEEQFRLAKEQIEALKDVFSRLADRQQYPRHQKKR